MRIISDFHDYYDSALSYGIDPNLIYLRKQQKLYYGFKITDKVKQLPGNLDAVLKPVLDILFKIPEGIKGILARRNDPHIDISSKIIGFCGRIYPAIDLNNVTYYSPQSLVSLMPSSILSRLKIDQNIMSDWISKTDKWNYGKRLTFHDWNKMIEEIGSKRFDDIFIEMKAPIFVCEYDNHACNLVINPLLSKLSFQKIKSPTEAFQEISMYLGNQLAVQNDPSSVISDDILRDKKGFDKWSFRQHKDDVKG